MREIVVTEFISLERHRPKSSARADDPEVER